LWEGTGGSAEGYRLFVAWSRRWPGYNAEKTKTFWRTIKTPRRDITVATVFYMAEKEMPGWRERQYYDRKVIARIDEFLVLMGDDQ